MGPYLKKNDLEKSYIVMNWGHSDFLYVSLHSAEQTEAFVVLLELFGKHKFTLGCAFPTAV